VGLALVIGTVKSYMETPEGDPALLFGGAIAIIYVLHRRFALNAVLAFWLAYILTRPLGASIGDYLSQPTADGGRGLGTTVTSAIFLVTIVLVVLYLSITGVDRTENRLVVSGSASDGRVGAGVARVLVVANKTAATASLVDAVRQRAAAGFSLTLKVAKHTDPPFPPFYARDPMAIKEVSERFRFDAHSLCRILLWRILD